MKHPTLLMDRHLDQLIMCAVYVTCKVLHNELLFQKIMEHYRHQPQSRNHVKIALSMMEMFVMEFDAFRCLDLPECVADSACEFQGQG